MCIRYHMHERCACRTCVSRSPRPPNIVATLEVEARKVRSISGRHFRMIISYDDNKGPDHRSSMADKDIASRALMCDDGFSIFLYQPPIIHLELWRLSPRIEGTCIKSNQYNRGNMVHTKILSKKTNSRVAEAYIMIYSNLEKYK